mgnify:CR=1 FL=1
MKKIICFIFALFISISVFAERYEGKVFVIINEVDYGKILVKKENGDLVVADEWENSVKSYGQNKVILEKAAERDKQLKDNPFHTTSDIDELAIRWLNEES